MSNSHLDHDRLSDYWNALSRGLPAEELAHLGEAVDPAMRAAIDQASALYRQRRADPAFVARLEVGLLIALEPAPAVTIPVEMARPTPSNGRIAAKAAPAPVVASPRSGPRASFARASLAAALLVLITGVGSYFGMVSPERLPFSGSNMDHGASWPAAHVEVGDVAVFGGNPQRTGEMPGPGIAVPSTGGGCCWWLGGWATPAIVDAVAYFVGSLEGLPGTSPVSAAAIGKGDNPDMPVWTSRLDTGSSSSPAVANGLVYFGDNSGRFFALETATGTERWQFAGEPGWAGAPVADDRAIYFATGPYFNLNPALSGDTLYFGVGKSPAAPTVFVVPKPVVYSVDALTGKELWRYDDFPADSAGVYAFDAVTGSIKWQFEFATLSLTPPRAVVQDGMVFFGSVTSVYALDALSGEQRWQFRPRSGRQPFCSTPSDIRVNAYYGISASSHRVYFGTSDGTLYALDSATGQEIWVTRPGNADFCGAPAVVDETVYFVDTAGMVFVLRASDGSQVWSHKVGGPMTNCRGLPLVHDQALIILCGEGGLIEVSGLRDESLSRSQVN